MDPNSRRPPMRTSIAAIAVLALLACSDALAPVTLGAPYQLRTVNGEPLPWSTPPSDSQYIPMTIVEGSVTFLDNSTAERQESAGRWVIDPSGDSVWLSYAWSQIAFYERGARSIVLTYPGFQPGAIGPSHAAETLYVAREGALTLRETGLISPLDSMIRVYCTGLN